MKKGKSSGRNGLLPNSLKIISSCLKTVSTNATTVVRSAGATVAASISVVASDDQKDQVLWAGFDKIEFSPSAFRHVLLLGYTNGFQVVDVEDASNVRELVSKRDGPVAFLQMQPIPVKSEAHEGFIASHPLLLVVAGDESNSSGLVHGAHFNGLIRDSASDPQPGNSVPTPTVVRFYSLRSHSYVHVLRFRSAVYIIRCSPRIIAVALAAQIYCFDAVTLESKFSVLTYPIPQVGQGLIGVNIGYGPMAVGPRWLAYASNNPPQSNTGRLSPQNLTPSPGVSPSTSPGSGNLVARYAVESSKQLAAGIINLGDMGYKTLSKYCQELLPDGSNSPVSSNSSWKVGRVTSAGHPNETDNAGMVIVKDFVSKAIISQFRGHTSPISALCFDPSGTLLVTASIHGNNINVFRIMPSRVQNGSSSMRYDWSSSHVHLYKLYRGLTTAVIQDICFSHCSQFISIVSSRGTCHIFLLSPFGGDVGLETQNFHSGGSLLPNLSLPWWSTSTCMINQQSPPPPPPVTLSVVGRIKNANGWLNTVSSATASATGKVSVPSGAVAAVFHNSVYHNHHPTHLKSNSLEHLLVYSPSAHVIQHNLLPSLGIASCDSNSRSGFCPSGPVQDEELRVNAETVQWWDACRRSNWPEREESLTNIAFDRSENGEIVMDISDCEDNYTKDLKLFNNTTAGKNMVKTHERHNWYLSNAEVQINPGGIQIWQKSKIYFYMMIPSKASGMQFGNDGPGGETEIEKLPVQEIEIRQKDLLPVFEHFHSTQSVWNDRGLVGERYPSASSCLTHQTKDKFMEETVNMHSKSASSGSLDGSDIGSSRTAENLLHLDRRSSGTAYGTIGLQQTEKLIPNGTGQSSVLVGHLVKDRDGPRKNSSDPDCVSFLSEHSNKGGGCIINYLSSLGSNSLSVGGPVGKGALSSNDGVSCEVSNTSSINHSSSSPNIRAEETGLADQHNPLDFVQYFHEGYCKVSELDDCRDLTEVVTDADSSSSHCGREKPEDDGDNDDMLGGVFAFCEEVSELVDCRDLTEVVTDADSSSSHCGREKPEDDGDNDDILGGVFAFCEEG
ncbi:autophagy-related protein 18g-like isoform X2 [Tasmannia lanceolata]|uniref:autophagy-related protein 18g-like isoform X2 n=1 Tax=Tasmannia lanceolata TaxID=3420 RepID=UPI004063A4BC